MSIYVAFQNTAVGAHYRIFCYNVFFAKCLAQTTNQFVGGKLSLGMRQFHKSALYLSFYLFTLAIIITFAHKYAVTLVTTIHLHNTHSHVP